jgi:hypothetical protein
VPLTNIKAIIAGYTAICIREILSKVANWALVASQTGHLLIGRCGAYPSQDPPMPPDAAKRVFKRGEREDART